MFYNLFIVLITKVAVQSGYQNVNSEIVDCDMWIVDCEKWIVDCEMSVFSKQVWAMSPGDSDPSSSYIAVDGQQSPKCGNNLSIEPTVDRRRNGQLLDSPISNRNLKIDQTGMGRRSSQVKIESRRQSQRCWNQISTKPGPDSRFVDEANIKIWWPNSSRSLLIC